MNTIATRIMLALTCGLLWAGPAMSANEMRFSDIEARIATVEQKTSAIPGLTSAAFLSDGDAIDAIAPNDAVSANGDEVMASPASSHGAACGSGNPCCCNSACDCGSSCGGPNECGCGNEGSYYADVELMFLRAHMMENVVGKLSEKYEFSPRFVLGYETAQGVGARVRYWTYGRTATILNAPEDIRFEFDVLDIEATSRFKSCRSELVVGGGFRFANVETSWDDESVSIDAPGITVAADLRTLIFSNCGREWAAVFGARWSILGGDWEGSDNGLIEPVRDDNVVAQELYAGVEYSQHFRNYVMFTRLVFEMQNWHSDALSESTGADSIGLIGPGLHVGMAF